MVLVSDTPFLKPFILQTPFFLWENSGPPLFGGISKT